MLTLFHNARLRGLALTRIAKCRVNVCLISFVDVELQA